MLRCKTLSAAIMTIALASDASSDVIAGIVTLDFQSVTPNAGNGPALLASYGITLSGISPSGPSGAVDIWNISSAYSPGSLWVNQNFLMQNGGGAPPVSFTMNFATPLDSISFDRIATPVNLSTEPQWSATAYAGSTPVGTVGESLGSWGGGAAARTFTLSGNGITSLTISANGFGFTGIGAVPLNNFVLNEVPEPSTMTLAMLGLASAGVVRLRARNRRSQPHAATSAPSDLAT